MHHDTQKLISAKPEDSSAQNPLQANNSSSNNKLSPQVVQELKKLGIGAVVMLNTAEVLCVNEDFAENLERIPNKNHRRHRNKLGYIDPTVAGIDIGDKVIHVAIPDGKGGNIVKEFGTTTPDLIMIVKELEKAGVKTGAMEATGVYWIPLYEIMEDSTVRPALVDPKHVKNVPGRKSDVVDCQWIQVLYSNGLVRDAFRPPKDRLKLRSYVRQRLNIIKSRQIALEHMEKALQLMNIKLSTAVSDIASITGMDIIQAILAGERDPVKLAKLRNYRCKKTDEVFVAALTGNFREEHLFVLQQAVAQYDFSYGQLKECDNRIRAELESFPTLTQAPLPQRDKDKKRTCKFDEAKKPDKNELSFDARTLLWQKAAIDITALPGIQALTALLVFAELGGTDMSHWETVKQFGSWLRLCPGNNISGGKRRKSKKLPCSNYISQALRMSAMSAKSSNTSVGAQIRRISGRTDKPKGIKAGAHKIAHLLYYMCKEGWQYYEKGVEHYEKAYQQRHLRNLEKQAKKQGYKLVSVENAA